MTEQELIQIESRIGISLPGFYRTTMLEYPFPGDSFAAEVFLPNNPDFLINMNPKLRAFGEIEMTFFTGSNESGDVKYYIDANSPAPVVFRIGRGNEKMDWTEHLDQLTIRSEEIEKEKKIIAERKANKQWWEFWK